MDALKISYLHTEFHCWACETFRGNL